MASESSSAAAESTASAATTPPSSPSTPQQAKTPDTKSNSNAINLDQFEAEDEKARAENDKLEAKRRAALLKKRKKKAHTKEERESKARELDDLLRQSAAFGAILTNKTKVLGRVGSGLDGKALGEHNLTMAQQPKCMVGGQMRDYQLEGLTWMFEICSQGMSGILADEMGLGKTIQTIALIALLREQEDYLGPHLIVAPLSTLANWIAEFKKWCPSIPVLLYHGHIPDREQLRRDMLFKNLENGRPTKQFPIVCTSYDIILRDRAYLSKINWEFIIIDEGHRLKNADAKLFRELRTFTSATRLLITGTPLQNNLKELWSLLHFLLPTIFTDWEAFESWFDFSDLEDEEGTESFIADAAKQDLIKKVHTILQPLLLRRMKADVAHNLPKKREYVLFAPMTKEQTDLYNVITNEGVDTRAFLENKAVERLAAVESPAPPRKASPRPSRPASLASRSAQESTETPKPKGKQAKESDTSASPVSLPVRQTRGRARLSEEVELVGQENEAPVAKSTSKKRKSTIVLDESPPAKSAKSSRQSTPASSVRGSRAASSRAAARRVYNMDESEDEDKMSDGEFEAKLARRFAEEEQLQQSETPESAQGMERSASFDLAKKQIATKKLGNPLMQLRLVCNTPHHFYNPWEADPDLPIDESIVTASGKMVMLDRLLPALFKRGHKVLIFSQFKVQLDVLEDYARDLRGWKVCRIDGTVAQADRQTQIDEFNASDEYKLFLLSTRAGGQGINLASADTVILFDSDWNPQQDLQAQDRAHRIGQKRPVVVYRIATKGTVEEELLMSAEAKRRLEKLVIKKGGFKTMGQKMDSREELDKETLRRLLLKDGEVYKISDETNVFSEEDLERLCDRSDAAYDKGGKGEGNSHLYKVVETGAGGLTVAG